MKDWFMKLVPGLIGAAIGGFVGYKIYRWGLRQGLVAEVFPGAFIGLGGGLFSDRPSKIRGAICGVAALALGLWIEWSESALQFGDFLAHVPRISPLILIMIALGTFLGFRWGGDAFRPRLPGKPKPTTIS
jgi:hypothetical protein